MKKCNNKKCGKPIPHDGTSRKYCDDECLRIVANINQRKARKAKGKDIHHVCPSCQNEWTDRKPRKVYCDTKCKNAYNEKNNKAIKNKYYDKRRVDQLSKMKEVKCSLPDCETIFLPLRGRIYCSDKCSDAAALLRQKEEVKQRIKLRFCVQDGCTNTWYSSSLTKKNCGLDTCTKKKSKPKVKKKPVKRVKAKKKYTPISKPVKPKKVVMALSSNVINCLNDDKKKDEVIVQRDYTDKEKLMIEAFLSR